MHRNLEIDKLHAYASSLIKMARSDAYVEYRSGILDELDKVVTKIADLAAMAEAAEPINIERGLPIRPFRWLPPPAAEPASPPPVKPDVPKPELPPPPPPVSEPTKPIAIPDPELPRPSEPAEPLIKPFVRWWEPPCYSTESSGLEGEAPVVKKKAVRVPWGEN